MKKIKVLHRRNLPTKIPVFSTITILLAIDYYAVSDMVKKGVYLYLGILWFCVIVRLAIQDNIDIFK